MAVYPHTKTTPALWKFLYRVADELDEMFDEVVWVGSDRDREVGKRIYPKWGEFSDDGDFKKLADLIWNSRLMIGCGSSPITLAGALKVPGIRVHDPIGDHPRVIWSNLGANQMNEGEKDLRTLWPRFRDEFLT
jgi:ADP-heptose:LPS heptosyltransferase